MVSYFMFSFNKHSSVLSVNSLVFSQFHVQSILYLLLKGVFDIDKEKGLKLMEISKGVSVDDVRAATGCSFQVNIIIHWSV